MKRIPLIISQLVAFVIAALIHPPWLWADGANGTSGPALLDADTDQLFDSQHPNHVIVAGTQTVTLTGHGTVTLTSVGGGTLYGANGIGFVTTDTAFGTVTGTGTGTGTGTATGNGVLSLTTSGTTTDTWTETNSTYFAGQTGSNTITVASTGTNSTTRTQTFVLTWPNGATLPGSKTHTATLSGTATATITATVTATTTGTGTATTGGTSTGTVSGTATVTKTVSHTGTVSNTSTYTLTSSQCAVLPLWMTVTMTGTWVKSMTTAGTGTITATFTQTGTVTKSNTVTATATESGNYAATAPVTATASSTATGSGTGTWTSTVTNTSTVTSASVSSNPTIIYAPNGNPRQPRDAYMVDNDGCASYSGICPIGAWHKPSQPGVPIAAIASTDGVFELIGSPLYYQPLESGTVCSWFYIWPAGTWTLRIRSSVTSLDYPTYIRAEIVVVGRHDPANYMTCAGSVNSVVPTGMMADFLVTELFETFDEVSYQAFTGGASVDIEQPSTKNFVFEPSYPDGWNTQCTFVSPADAEVHPPVHLGLRLSAYTASPSGVTVRFYSADLISPVLGSAGCGGGL